MTRPESKALVGRGEIAGQEVILAKPQTMMNLSGVAVRMLLERYESAPAELIVLLDEVDLPWGMLRIRDQGVNSTHNGLKSIIGAIGTDEFIRVRLGVQPKQQWGDRRDYAALHDRPGRAADRAADGRRGGRCGRTDFDRRPGQGDVAIQSQGNAGRRRLQ